MDCFEAPSVDQGAKGSPVSRNRPYCLAGAVPRTCDVSHFALLFGLVGVFGPFFGFLAHDTYTRSFQLALQFATGRVIHNIDLASSDNQRQNL